MTDLRIPHVDEIQVLDPGTDGMLGWRVVGDIGIGASHDHDEVVLWYNATEEDFPSFRIGDREADGTLPFICGTACAIFEYGGVWRLGTVEQLRGLTNRFGLSERGGCGFPAEHLGMHLDDLPWRPSHGAIVGFVVTGPSHRAEDLEKYHQRSRIAYFEWGSGELKLVAVEGHEEPPPPPPGKPCAGFADEIENLLGRLDEEFTGLLERMRGGDG